MCVCCMPFDQASPFSCSRCSLQEQRCTYGLMYLDSCSHDPFMSTATLCSFYWLWCNDAFLWVLVLQRRQRIWQQHERQRVTVHRTCGSCHGQHRYLLTETLIILKQRVVLASASGSLAAVFVQWRREGSLSVTHLSNGMLAGCVAICAGAGHVRPWAATCTGIVGALRSATLLCPHCALLMMQQLFCVQPPAGPLEDRRCA